MEFLGSPSAAPASAAATVLARGAFRDRNDLPARSRSSAVVIQLSDVLTDIRTGERHGKSLLQRDRSLLLRLVV
jgi:hypothetical protein